MICHGRGGGADWKDYGAPTWQDRSRVNCALWGSQVLWVLGQRFHCVPGCGRLPGIQAWQWGQEQAYRSAIGAG